MLGKSCCQVLFKMLVWSPCRRVSPGLPLVSAPPGSEPLKLLCRLLPQPGSSALWLGFRFIPTDGSTCGEITLLSVLFESFVWVLGTVFLLSILVILVPALPFPSLLTTSSILLIFSKNQLFVLLIFLYLVCFNCTVTEPRPPHTPDYLFSACFCLR